MVVGISSLFVVTYQTYLERVWTTRFGQDSARPFPYRGGASKLVYRRRRRGDRQSGLRGDVLVRQWRTMAHSLGSAGSGTAV